MAFEFPFKKYVEATWTADEANIVCLGCEKQKYFLYVHSSKNGKLLHKFQVKYDGFKVTEEIYNYVLNMLLNIIRRYKGWL